jgi:tetratricopeptide (TPR) repeat protein
VGTGNQALAIAKYRSLLDVDPSNIFALNNLAYLLAPEHPEEALKLAQAAVELAPDDPDVQGTIGWVYYRMQNYTRAVQYLERAVAKNPTPQRKYRLAMSCLKAGEQSRGREILAAALKTDPNLPNSEKAW